ncbi:MAG TPA: alpha/beta fold hydrolase [Thermoanaerobaculia bacterium]|nr:alpha/beta fold hydrolase [Thermoanaerobaculia bacterium]
MTARTAADARARKRRVGCRLLRGTLLLSGAVALPLLAGAFLRRRTAPLPAVRWGRSRHYAWDLGAVAFQELGSGPAVVLLHSLGPGHHGAEWLAAADRLAETHHVYVPDLLGWGRSDKPRLTYTPDLYLDLLDDFLSEVVREPAVVAAAGSTAPYAVRLAVERPQRVRGLALVAPHGLEGGRRAARRAVLRALVPVPVVGSSALDLMTSRGALARHLRRDVYAAPERVDAALLEHHWRAAHAPAARPALAAWAAGRLDLPVADDLLRLQTPVWLAWGRAARHPSPATAALWQHHLPKADLHLFERSSALPHAEEPQAFANALAHWIRSLPSSLPSLPVPAT